MSSNCIAPVTVGAAHVGEISWTAIFQTLISQGMSYITAQKEADRQYQLALANQQKQAGGAGSTGDNTQMILLVGAAVALALILTMRK